MLLLMVLGTPVASIQDPRAHSPQIRNAPVTPTPSSFPKYCRTNGGRTAVQMGGVQYKWEAYCRVSLSSKLNSRKVRRYKWGAYCRTNWRCTAVLILDKFCDPGRHLQECSGARAGKCPTECFLSDFGHLARSSKSAKKHSKSTL